MSEMSFEAMELFQKQTSAMLQALQQEEAENPVLTKLKEVPKWKSEHKVDLSFQRKEA